MGISVGGDPFETQRCNARSFKAELCKRTFNEDIITEHLNDCVKNPTIGLIAGIREYGPHYQRMLKQLKKISEIKNKIDDFEIQFKEMYPKTWKTRLKLIKNENIVFYGHKPIGVMRNLLKSIRSKIFKLIS